MPKFLLLHADLFAGKRIKKTDYVNTHQDILLEENQENYLILHKGREIVEQLRNMQEEYIIILFHQSISQLRKIQATLEKACRQINFQCFIIHPAPADVKVAVASGEDPRRLITDSLAIPRGEKVQSIVFDEETAQAEREGFTAVNISQPNFDFLHDLVMFMPLPRSPLVESTQEVSQLPARSILAGLARGEFNGPRLFQQPPPPERIDNNIGFAKYDEIVALKNKLTKEVNSFWPYPYKAFKRAKVEFLEKVLCEYDAKNQEVGSWETFSDRILRLKSCINKIKKNFPDLYHKTIAAGWFSNRTRDLLHQIETQPEVSRTTKIHDRKK